MIKDIFQYPFLQHAIAVCVLASIICGITGTIIIEKKMAMMTGGISHAAFGGVGLSYFLGFEPLLGALMFSILSALGIKKITKENKVYIEAATSIFWALGMALGIIFIQLTPGYPPDMTSFLFGDILLVSSSDLLISAIITLIIVLCTFMWFSSIEAWLFDDEYLLIVKKNTTGLEYLIYLLISISIVSLIKTTGIILSLALITAPASTARFFTKSTKSTMLFATLIALLECFVGLVVSYYNNLPTGSVIVIISCLVFFLFWIIKKVQNKL